MCTSSRSQAVCLGTQHSTLGKGAGMCERTQIGCHHMPGTGSKTFHTVTYVQCKCLPTRDSAHDARGGLTNVHAFMHFELSCKIQPVLYTAGTVPRQGSYKETQPI